MWLSCITDASDIGYSLGLWKWYLEPNAQDVRKTYSYVVWIKRQLLGKS
jgi:hypothetical protein